jgi:hypothetical protein
MTSADFSASVPLHYCRGGPVVNEPKRRSPQVRLAFFSQTRRIYPAAFRMTIGLPHPWLGDPTLQGPLIQFLYVESAISSSAFFRSRLAADTLA